jgi:hypothetical protein
MILNFVQTLLKIPISSILLVEGSVAEDQHILKWLLSECSPASSYVGVRGKGI